MFKMKAEHDITWTDSTEIRKIYVPSVLHMMKMLCELNFVH